MSTPSRDFSDFWSRYANEFDWDENGRIESVASSAWVAGQSALYDPAAPRFTALTDAEVGALMVALSDDEWAQDEVGETLRALLQRLSATPEAAKCEHGETGPHNVARAGFQGRDVVCPGPEAVKCEIAVLRPFGDPAPYREVPCGERLPCKHHSPATADERTS